MSQENIEPEILVPPDMESLEIEDIKPTKEFPVIKLIYSLVPTLGILIFTVIGIIIFIKTGNLSLSIPFWATSVLVFPFALYYLHEFVNFYELNKGHQQF